LAEGGKTVMLRKTLPAAILIVVMATMALSANATEAADLAMGELGTGSAEEIRERLIKKGYAFLEPQFRQAVTAHLPDQILQQRVRRGSMLRRAEKAFTQVLELYGRGGTIEIVLYKSEIQQAVLWRGCVLTLSDALAGPLTDTELLGILAHELAHTYFMDEIMTARRDGDVRSMKVVELKCDAVAYLTLKLLGRETGYYITRLRKMEKMAKEAGIASKLAQTHPEMRERARFLERFAQQLGR
jgi:Zn-dependent protease with chaperone function